MNTLFNLFGMIEAGKSASLSEKDSQELDGPSHKEDTSQGGEFLDDVTWETESPLKAGSQPDFHSDPD